MLLKQEDSNARMNRMKIFNKWRTYMRIAKADELSKDIDILSQDHVRQVDRMDNLIHSLMIDITALNQQYETINILIYTIKFRITYFYNLLFTLL